MRNYYSSLSRSSLSFVLVSGVLIFISSCAASQLNQGIVAIERAEYDKAYEAFTEVIHDNPDNARAYFYLGQIDLLQQDFIGAIDRFEEAISIDPELEEEINLFHGEQLEAYRAKEWINLYSKEGVPIHVLGLFEKPVVVREIIERRGGLALIDVKRWIPNSPILSQEVDGCSFTVIDSCEELAFVRIQAWSRNGEFRVQTPMRQRSESQLIIIQADVRLTLNNGVLIYGCVVNPGSEPSKNTQVQALCVAGTLQNVVGKEGIWLEFLFDDVIDLHPAVVESRESACFHLYIKPKNQIINLVLSLKVISDL